MKKMCSVVAILAVVLVVAGCGSQYVDSEFVGVWQATKAEKSDVTVNVEDVFGVMSLTLEANGKGTLMVGSHKTACQWKPLEKGAEVTAEDWTLTFKQTKDNVIASDFNGITISFEALKDE